MKLLAAIKHLDTTPTSPPYLQSEIDFHSSMFISILSHRNEIRIIKIRKQIRQVFYKVLKIIRPSFCGVADTNEKLNKC